MDQIASQPTIDYKAVVRRLAELARGNTTMLEAAPYRIDAAQYSDSARFEVEKERIFRRTPLLAALSCELSEPGSFRTLEIADVPLLVARNKDYSVKTFINVCRHRGATLVAAQEGCSSRFTCPYHGWTYDGAGTLIGVARGENFGPFDRGALNLVELPCEERDGLIWTILTPGLELDLDRHLGSLAPEIAAFGLARANLTGKDQLLESVNWKLTMDTYLENYHVAALHKDTLAMAALSDVSLWERYGPHQRMAAARKAVLTLDEANPDWNPFDYMSLNYIIYPNLVLLVTPESAMVSQILPGKEWGKSITVIKHFTLRPIAGQEEQDRFTLRTKLLNQAIETEDYVMQAGVQANLASNANQTFLFGRNEGGLHHFHRAVDEAYEAAMRTPKESWS